ncbi:MAG TPA: MoaD/ThiS family protein [Anaerolineae bacterium]|nr:MoaD/ThiS family protein [Anaerolineae bacterium]HQH39811.1 MoaD/ThiS family protein [Anaerolineae bacterium]
MQITVRFFAVSREMTGAERQLYTLPEGATLQDLQDQLFAAYPALEAQRVRFAVNLTYALLNTPLHDSDEVACIPPVGGG